eukprot:CAMPEP_0198119372 /NCGR_PEP_ID=MMETSP1442-20131203/25361_1 /TAXON_ID= /ORGANISM="Craspedostauros australis, Strain CCMP3328" /LENGTH=210 /DNA_ID=CAMNT_0043777823 /DNA_START=269 /DNA_END=901 /DNA_ORIENTATION=-
MFDDTKLRKRRHDHSTNDTVLPHHYPQQHQHQAQKGASTPKSHKRVFKKKRYHRRTVFWNLLRTCLGGMAASVVSGSLSLMLLPSEWIQVDYKHQVQNAASRVVQNIRRRRHPNHGDRKPTTSSMDEVLQQQKFTCSDGVTIAYLNDGYCDCEDGMDEPNTPACSYLTIQDAVFHCVDGTTTIYASRILDGVRDCPDGSDEDENSGLVLS